jgi:hypothetical protein
MNYCRNLVGKSRRSVEVDRFEDKQDSYIIEDSQRFEASMAILHKIGDEMEGRPAKIKIRLDPLFLGLFKK